MGGRGRGRLRRPEKTGPKKCKIPLENRILRLQKPGFPAKSLYKITFWNPKNQIFSGASRRIRLPPFKKYLIFLAPARSHHFILRAFSLHFISDSGIPATNGRRTPTQTPCNSALTIKSNHHWCQIALMLRGYQNSYFLFLLNRMRSRI